MILYKLIIMYYKDVSKSSYQSVLEKVWLCSLQVFAYLRKHKILS